MNMKWCYWIEKREMSSLSRNMGFPQMDWKPKDPDGLEAWQLIIELVTRVAPQDITPEAGDEKTAWEGVHRLLTLTRENPQRGTPATVNLPSLPSWCSIRLFAHAWPSGTAFPWKAGLQRRARGREFRADLAVLRGQPRQYSHRPAHGAGVEDLANLESRT
jgi:hypothetical protein